MEDRYSYSRLTAFHQCPYEFYLNYILDDEEREICGYTKEGNYWAQNGSLVHSILEQFFRGEIPLENLVDVYLDRYPEEVTAQTKESTMNSTVEKCVDYFATLEPDWMEGWEVLGTEIKFDFYYMGYKFLAFIDLLLKNKETGELWIIDHKSLEYPFKKNGEVKAKCKKEFPSHKRQMHLYSYAVKERYGRFPSKISWNHFKDKKIATIDFDEKDYLESMKWCLDTIKKIKKEDEFAPREEFFYCKNLCDFRHSCEYRKASNV